MSYHVANRSSLGYAMESPQPITPKPTITRLMVSAKPSSTAPSNCAQQGGTWSQATGKCLMPDATIQTEPTPLAIGPTSPTPETNCLTGGGVWTAADSSCTFIGVPEAQCLGAGGTYYPNTTTCVFGGVQTQPQPQGWWSGLSDTTKYAIIGGAVLGVAAIGTGIYMVARKPKAVANARRRARYAVEFYARGMWRLGRKFATLSGARAHEHNSVKYYGSASTRIVDLVGGATPNASGVVTLKFPPGAVKDYVQVAVELAGYQKYDWDPGGSTVVLTPRQYAEFRSVLNAALRDKEIDQQEKHEIRRVLEHVSKQATPNPKRDARKASGPRAATPGPRAAIWAIQAYIRGEWKGIILLGPNVSQADAMRLSTRYTEVKGVATRLIDVKRKDIIAHWLPVPLRGKKR